MRVTHLGVGEPCVCAFIPRHTFLSPSPCLWFTPCFSGWNGLIYWIWGITREFVKNTLGFLVQNGNSPLSQPTAWSGRIAFATISWSDSSNSQLLRLLCHMGSSASSEATGTCWLFVNFSPRAVVHRTTLCNQNKRWPITCCLSDWMTGLEDFCIHSDTKITVTLSRHDSKLLIRQTHSPCCTAHRLKSVQWFPDYPSRDGF